MSYPKRIRLSRAKGWRLPGGVCMTLSEVDPPQDDWDHREWVECESCFGNGQFEDCFEDTCCCLNPPCHWSTCDVCEGKGGWYLDDDE